jgi:hypothetical protein
MSAREREREKKKIYIYISSFFSLILMSRKIRLEARGGAVG